MSLHELQTPQNQQHGCLQTPEMFMYFIKFEYSTSTISVQSSSFQIHFNSGVNKFTVRKIKFSIDHGRSLCALYTRSKGKVESLNIWKSFDCTNVVQSQGEIRFFTRESSRCACTQEPRPEKDLGLSTVQSQRTHRPLLNMCRVNNAYVPSVGLAKLASTES